MPVTDIKRPNYYEGQYLGAMDLMAEQEYQRHQDQRHRLAAHTWGIAAGLELEEREQPVGSGMVDVFIKPGYAVDGFGRTLVVLEPAKLREEWFAQFPPDPNIWIPVWLRYREERTNPPRPGFQVCDVEEQRVRILETYRIAVGNRPTLPQQRSHISVAGRTMDAGAEVPDASVPYQMLLEVGEDPLWLIPIGKVRWSGNRFIISETEDEKKEAGEGRRYIGVVAESVLAPAAKLLVKDRQSSSPLPSADKGVEVALEGSLSVERLLNAKQDVHIHGSLGVGTTSPSERLEVSSGRLKVTGASGGSIRISGADEAIAQGLRITDGAAGSGLALSGNPLRLNWDAPANSPIIFADGASVERMRVAAGGDVGIGTTSPSNRLHISGNTGIRQNRLYLSGGDGWSSLTYNAYHNAANSAWVFPDSNRAAVTIEMDDSSDMPRFQVWSTTSSDKTAWRQRLAIDGNSGSVLMAHNGGNVGIGAINPGERLQVDDGSIFINGEGQGIIVDESGMKRVGFMKYLGREAGIWRVSGQDFEIGRVDSINIKSLGANPSVDVYVSGSGNIGIGTTTPAERLDVRGHIMLHTDGSLFAPGGVENIRILRGTVRSNGGIAAGSGFGVIRVATGLYAISFSPSFPSRPSASVTQVFPGVDNFGVGGNTKDNAVIVGIDINQMKVKTGDSEGAPVDRDFTFIVMGPR